MLLVIFGAGASYDSVPERDWSTDQKLSPYRPPLAPGLFDKREPFDEAIEAYSTAAPMIGELRNAVATQEPIEEALQRFAQWANDGDEAVSRQLMAVRFYLDRIIRACGREWLALARGVTNYSVLLNKIERWRRRVGEERVLLVTFNYDSLLEAARIAIGERGYDSLDDHVFKTSYPIVKPHGSVTWQRLVRFSASRGSADRLISEAPVLALTDFYTPRGQTTEDYAAIPALAVPTVEKSVFECPEEHVDLLKRLLPQVDRVLIIGWRAQERTFVEIVGDLVNADSLRGSVISGSRKGAEETVLRLQEIWAGADLTPFPKGFTEFVLTDESLLSLLED